MGNEMDKQCTEEEIQSEISTSPACRKMKAKAIIPSYFPPRRLAKHSKHCIFQSGGGFREQDEQPLLVKMSTATAFFFF